MEHGQALQSPARIRRSLPTPLPPLWRVGDVHCVRLGLHTLHLLRRGWGVWQRVRRTGLWRCRPPRRGQRIRMPPLRRRRQHLIQQGRQRGFSRGSDLLQQHAVDLVIAGGQPIHWPRAQGLQGPCGLLLLRAEVGEEEGSRGDGIGTEADLGRRMDAVCVLLLQAVLQAGPPEPGQDRGWGHRAGRGLSGFLLAQFRHGHRPCSSP
mmetsp:Transcript_111761/g.193954  ORF Transcript_111761/g.193954 Transcript_111761/m.193954 type:complete len:207 (-) Transcript_111761:437-1057(-)